MSASVYVITEHLRHILCILFVCLFVLGWWCWRAGLQTTLQLTVTSTSWLAMKTATEPHTQAHEHKHTQPPANVEQRSGLLGYTPRPPHPLFSIPPIQSSVYLRGQPPLGEAVSSQLLLRVKCTTGSAGPFSQGVSVGQRWGSWPRLCQDT